MKKVTEPPEARLKPEFYYSLTLASQSRVLLSIGGQLFETTRQTLLKYDSIFKDLLQENNVYSPEIIESKPCYFFDRDPTHFPLILYFLRTGVFVWPKDPKEEQAVRLELRFYQVRDLIEKTKFGFQEYNDRNGILFYLGSRNRYSFENPLEKKEMEVFLGDSNLAYLRSKLIEAPLSLLFEFSDKIPDDKVVFSPKNPNAFCLIRFRSIRVKPNIITIENVKSKDVDYASSEIRFFGMRSEGLVEAVKDKEDWVQIECKKFENNGFWKRFDVTCDEFYNTIKIEKDPGKNSCQLMMSGIEIYGSISEKA